MTYLFVEQNNSKTPYAHPAIFVDESVIPWRPSNNGFSTIVAPNWFCKTWYVTLCILFFPRLSTSFFFEQWSPMAQYAQLAWCNGSGDQMILLRLFYNNGAQMISHRLFYNNGAQLILPKHDVSFCRTEWSNGPILITHNRGAQEIFQNISHPFVDLYSPIQQSFCRTMATLNRGAQVICLNKTDIFGRISRFVGINTNVAPNWICKICHLFLNITGQWSHAIVWRFSFVQFWIFCL